MAGIGRAGIRETGARLTQRSRQLIPETRCEALKGTICYSKRLRGCCRWTSRDEERVMQGGRKRKPDRHRTHTLCCIPMAYHIAQCVHDVSLEKNRCKNCTLYLSNYIKHVEGQQEKSTRRLVGHKEKFYDSDSVSIPVYLLSLYTLLLLAIVAWYVCLYLSVCLSLCCPAKTEEPIMLPFIGQIRAGPRNRVLDH